MFVELAGCPFPAVPADRNVLSADAAAGEHQAVHLQGPIQLTRHRRVRAAGAAGGVVPKGAPVAPHTCGSCSELSNEWLCCLCASPPLQLYPDICNWKPKTKGITLRKFCVFCLVVPGVMTVEIRPADIEVLYEKALKAADERSKTQHLLQFALEQERLEAAMTQQEKDAVKKKRKAVAPSLAPRKIMDAEVFIEFALPMVRMRYL